MANNCTNCKWAFWGSEENFGSCNHRPPKIKEISTAHQNIHPILDKRRPHKDCGTFEIKLVSKPRSTPSKCGECDGDGYRNGSRGNDASKCEICSGSGIVWGSLVLGKK